MPDQPEHGMKGANVATNVYHAMGSYKRFPSLVSYTGASTVGKDAHGSGSFRDNSNTVYNFVEIISNRYFSHREPLCSHFKDKIIILK